MNNIVLDTNVVLDRTFESVLETFTEPTKVTIPLVVLEEADTFKKGHEPRNIHARAFNNFLDKLREQGKLHEGVPYREHIIQVDIKLEELDLNKPDYKIIKTAKEKGAVLVTQDINERVIADAVGVESTHFAPHDININELYTGVAHINIDADQVQEFYRTGFLPIDVHVTDEYVTKLLNNQFVVMHDELGGVQDGIYKADKGGICQLNRKYEAWNIKPKKHKHTGETISEQKYLMHLLLDPDIEFVSAIGPSGTGKTILTLAAALEQTLGRSAIYNKITVMRPLVAVGNDIGFLPGDKLEKLEPWMASTFDALEVLLDDYEMKDEDLDIFSYGAKEKVYRLIQEGRLELEAMAHIRGRSLSKQFLIVDDAQNLTQHEAASIITRAGEGTKVVFLGDLSDKQIDNHRLTPSSNGLAYVIDRLKGEDIVGHITLNNVVRSRLAQLGVEKL